QSLQKRNHLDPKQSYFLWIEHLLTCLPGVIEHKGLIVDYDRLMESAAPEIHRIAEHFSLPVIAEELQIYEQEFLDKNLRHTTYKPQDLAQDKTCPLLAQDIYCELLECASAADSKLADLAPKVTQWRTELARIKPLLAFSDEIWLQLQTATGNLLERDKAFYELNHTANLRDQTIHDLNQLINSLRSDIERQNRTLL